MIFHDTGNRIIKPYLGDYLATHLKPKLKQDIAIEIEDLEIENLKIDIDTLHATVIIDKLTKMKIVADLSLLQEPKKMIHNIQVNIVKGKIEELLRITKQEPYAKGEVSLQINIPSIKEKHPNATATITLYNALLDEKRIKKIVKIDIPSHTELNGTIDAELNENTVSAKGSFQSDLAHLDFKQANYNLKSKTIQSDYQLKIADLSKLKPINNRKLRGSMEVEGTILKDKNLTITGKSKDLEGELSFTLIDKKLHVIISNISVAKLIYTINYPQIFRGEMVGELNYHLSQKKGLFSSKLHNAQLLPNQLTTLIKRIQGPDLTKERYNETTLNAKINREFINFDFQAKSKTTTLKLHPALINRDNYNIDANYTLDIEDKDIGGTIKGKIDNPKISIDSSKFVEREIIDKVKEYIHIDDSTLKDLGIGEKEQEAVKELFRGFFK